MLTTDEQITPNYIPQNNMNDYIHQEPTDVYIDQEINSENTTKDWFDIIKIPILLIIMFLLFQTPIIKLNLNKYIPSLFTNEDTINFKGNLLLSIIFGGIFMAINFLMDHFAMV
jgi:hypothetical protein